MTRELWLVRHALPDIRPTVPPHRWRLGDQGRRQAAALANVLPPEAYAVASAEPKAVETLRHARYDAVHLDDGLDEVRRDEAFDGDFAARRRGYLDGDRLDGWEDPVSVVERFQEAVTRARLSAAGRPGGRSCSGHTAWP